MPKMLGLAALARCGKDTVANMLLGQEGVAAYAFADPLKNGCQALYGLTEAQTWGDEVKETTIPLWDMSPREMFQQVGTECMRRHDKDHWLKRAERALQPKQAESEESIYPDLQDQEAPFKLAAQAFFDLSDEQAWDTSQADHQDAYWGMSPNEMFDVVRDYVLWKTPDYYERRAQLPTEQPTKTLPQYDTMQAVIFKDIRFENEADFLRERGGDVWHIVRDNAQQVASHSSENGIGVKDGDIIIDNNGTLEQLENKVTQQWAIQMAGNVPSIGVEQVSSASLQEFNERFESPTKKEGLGL